MSEAAAMTETGRGRRRTLVGVVISVKMDKTAVVSVERRRPHPLYRKIVRTTKHYKAHDPHNEAVLGDVVRIEETRPISKDKHWRISETMTRGNVADLAPRDIGVPEEAILTPTPPAAARGQASRRDGSKPGCCRDRGRRRTVRPRRRGRSDGCRGRRGQGR